MGGCSVSGELLSNVSALIPNHNCGNRMSSMPQGFAIPEQRRRRGEDLAATGTSVSKEMGYDTGSSVSETIIESFG